MLNGMNPGHAKLADWGFTHLPELTPDFIRVRRTAVLDADGRDFR
jgi:hypothetical protein